MTASGATPGPEQQYFSALAAGRFQIQKCAACLKHVFYPRVLCPYCGSGTLEWIEPSGRGTVYSTTTVRRKVEAGGDYNVCLIDLEEGPRLMSRVEGVPAETVQIGMPVQARVNVEASGGLLVFVPSAVSQ
jgi:uncharacterized protein